MRGMTWALRIMGIGAVLAMTCIWPNAALAARARATDNRTASKPKTPADTAKQLRAEWKLGDLNMTREAVDDASFAADIKQAAINAIDMFTQRQEGLLAGVTSDPKSVAQARQSRAQLEKEFNQKMGVIYNDPKLMDELAKRLRALDKEMDDMSASADKLFAKLDTVNLTPQQKANLRPVLKEANTKIKNAVAKSATKSTKDQATREEVVKQFKAARAKVKQQLTPEQRAKLAKKDAE